VSAGKLGYSNCAKFVRRSVFVQSESDRDGVSRSMMTNGAMDSKGKVKCVTLEDSGSIRLMDVSCGRNHLVAVEAPSPGHVPRVFTWGCGDYGCLGHGMQADEYHPRLVGAFRGPVFANNHPVSAVAGGNCTLVLTRIGHVYYVGRHKSTGEATMRPSLVDALANNGHVATCVGAGSQTIFCSTRGGVTISWGNGSHGELGYGRDGKKSSAKPEFVGDLDSCIVTDVACGMGHTLFIVRNDDDEDAKALKRVGTVDESDLGYFLEQIKGRKVDAGADGEPAKKKQKGKGKK
jgi:alpha-tubulin suppressor-like RCC1 family protein